MSEYRVFDPDGDAERFVESRAEAEEVAETLGVEWEKVQTDGGAVVEEPETPVEPETVEAVESLPENPRIDEDPLDYMPGHFIDDIQGTPAINRKGYAVLAAHYNIGVKAEPVVRASETEFEFAEFQAVATTKDGVEYSGFGSAHVERMDGDDEYLLNELAETRACKRALALATGVGVVSVEEMENSL